MKFRELATATIAFFFSWNAQANTISEVWWVDPAGNASLLTTANWTATDSGYYGSWAAYDEGESSSRVRTSYGADAFINTSGTIINIDSWNGDGAYVYADTGDVWWVGNTGAVTHQPGANWTATDSGYYGNWAAYDEGGGTKRIRTSYGADTYINTSGSIRNIDSWSNSGAYVYADTGDVWWVSNTGTVTYQPGANWTATDSGYYGNWAAYDEGGGNKRVRTDLGANAYFNTSGTIINIDSWNGTGAYVYVSSVPLPGAIWLLGSGLIAMFGIAQRKVAQ